MDSPHERDSDASSRARAGSRSLDFLWLSYSIAAIIVAPVLLAYEGWRYLSGRSREGVLERLGLGPTLPSSARPRIWLHGVSVGEVQSLEPIVASLVKRRPDCELIVSVKSRTGYDRACELFQDRAHVRYVPVDLPWIVSAALRRIQPDLLVLGESELWPSLLRYASRRGPIVLVNGRVSDRTLRRAERARPLYHWMLQHVVSAGVQSTQDAHRFTRLGLSPGAIRVMGNTKFDRDIPLLTPREREDWRTRLRLGPWPLLVAGSTFPGEEEALLWALLRVRRTIPDARLLVAPRKVERAGEVLELILGCDLHGALRTDPDVEGNPDVVVLDTIGELSMLYGIGDIAFVGRSLTHAGGQNPAEPMAHGLPVLHGPHMENFRAAACVAGAVGATRVIHSTEELALAWEQLLQDPLLRGRMGEAGASMVQEHRGASERCARMILESLPVER